MHPIEAYVVVIVVPFFPFLKHESVLKIFFSLVKRAYDLVVL